jgi:threonine/homoserine/homoserine lactone efflux protein
LPEKADAIPALCLKSALATAPAASDNAVMDARLVLFGQSLLIGLSIAAPVGQIGVLAIQRTLQYGRAAGLATGLGAAVADALYGAVGAFGITVLIAWLVDHKTVFTLVGSLVLLWMAWRIARQAPTAARAAETTPADWLRHFAGTFVLTLSNPTTILSFLAVFGAIAGRTAQASPGWMVAGVLVGSALWWLVLATVVGQLRHRFDAHWQRRVNLASAALLGGFALWQLSQLVRTG